MPVDPSAPVPARELTSEVSLTAPDGTLNRSAVGWARRPLVDTSGIGHRPHRSFGRTKRWEYWNVIGPTHVLALTISSIDYAAVHEVWVWERGSGRTWGKTATVLPARGVHLPERLEQDVASARARGLEIAITPVGERRDGAAAAVRLTASIPGVEIDVTVTRPAGHECLAVVVPWSASRFQYTVKDVALPAAGTVTVDGQAHELAEGATWAVLDHGRGRWPYDARWNWGAGSGVTSGRAIGIQIGGQWTDGTGQTENGIVIDGTLHKIHDDIRWEFDRADYLRPWRMRSSQLDLTFTPMYHKRSATNLGVLSSSTHQLFGQYSGCFTTIVGERIVLDGITGWAEDVHQRW